ncbi:PAS domain S-box protein [Bacillus sp. BRMEA1]|uniref:PAS domain-containing sensor histidine kinase n=1 Tax=Neobacillus endophyticus TaxID=2738405 RepID=UPI00156624B6|nr:PAS domain S-box protein [Neobacillus endophyticus]NRD77773.1 PAS domain S-box protein [Neobacillus endophyticus]
MSKRFPILWQENESVIYNPEELIDLILDNTADGVCIFDMENRFIRINQMYTKIFGFTETDVLGERFDKFSAPDIENEVLEAAKQGKTFHNIVNRRRHKNGNKLDIAVSYSPFRNTTGEIIATVAVYRNITDRVTIERELKKTRKLYKLITENTTDLIKVFTKEYEIVYASPSYEKVLGFPPEEMVGRSVLEFSNEVDVNTMHRFFQKILENGEPQLIQHKVKTKDGGDVIAEFNISPIYNEKNEIDSFVSVGRNISDRLKNDEAIRNLDRLSIIGQLAAGVAHEIRNPLTSLKGFSKLLKSTSDLEKQDKYLSIIMNELDRIDMIVNEFMSLAKPQAIQFEQESLYSILESTINILHPQALLHNVQVVNHYQSDHIHLLCSPHQLKQVFVNFIKNAIEAMPNGGTVTIDAQKISNKRVQINIADEGLGIDNERLCLLGTPFYTTKDKGIGLGLTVSNKIIQEHKGTMKIESQSGKGTTVKVELECL